MELYNIEGILPSYSAFSPLGLDKLFLLYYDLLVPLLASKSISWLVLGLHKDSKLVKA